MNKLFNITAVGILSLMFSIFALAGSGDMKKDIVDTAAGNDDLSTLVVAIKEAGLVDTLKGEGPFTVFAPNNAAFAKLPADQLDALLADKEALAKVLTYHVVPGKVLAGDVVKSTEVTTVQGQPLAIKVENDKVYVDGAEVIATDIMTSNGVIHVIDSVVLPK